MKMLLVYFSFLLISITAERVYEDCYRTKLGRGYNGRVNVTASGRACQEWRSHLPHAHNFTWLWTEENFCRNPDDRASGPWCYTMDPDTVLESCDVPECTSNFDPCLMKPCHNGGKCQGQETPPYYRCECDSMWAGTECEIKVSQCQFHPCQNGATCMDVKEDFLCLCTEDFVGKTCELKIGLCDEATGWRRIGTGATSQATGQNSPGTTQCNRIIIDIYNEYCYSSPFQP
uniref:Hepatocyte growth factor-like protein n=1 Tax=Crassostrea virginica TaxID=6565 RepID=A0A8B8DN64_CRAVI|nr:hepatocyte growth factor-like protein [Crassostrea virginica]